VAHTDLSVALLSRADLHQLLQDRPRVGAHLLLAMALRMAQTLRETTRKLRLFAQMNHALGEELARMARGDGDDSAP
jgi:CRP-like cAMP-binding protein